MAFAPTLGVFTLTAFDRYLELQQYVNWTAHDAARVAAAHALASPHFARLVDDFYAEIENHPLAKKAITGGAEQVARLKTTLERWLHELFSGAYDHDYVERRSRVGLRHVEIGLDQVFVNAALSRLRRGLLEVIAASWTADRAALEATRVSVNTLIDLDLAIIEDAYQGEFQRRQAIAEAQRARIEQIVERQQAEQRYRAAEQRALQAERLAAIGETMTALVHESRNALQRSKANLEMLMLEIEDRPEAIRLVARVQKAQEDLHRHFEEVRQWAAPMHPRLEPCNLQELWREVWQQVKQAHGARQVRFVERVSGASPILEIDPFLMSQVFRNILENAYEASPEEAAVTIECGDAPDEAPDDVPHRRGITIAISDEGPGLSPEQERRICEPFFTTKTKGTGLGMAIAHRIVLAHRGLLSVSSPGGARIEIFLPR